MTDSAGTGWGRRMPARAITALTWLVYACLTAPAAVLAQVFYRLPELGDCFADTPCPPAQPPTPIVIAVAIGSAGLAFVMGWIVAWSPTHRIFGMSVVLGSAITAWWLAVAITSPDASTALFAGALSGIALAGSVLGWRGTFTASTTGLG